MRCLCRQRCSQGKAGDSSESDWREAEHWVVGRVAEEEVIRRNDTLRISLPRMQWVWFPEVLLMPAMLRVRCLAKFVCDLRPNGVGSVATALTLWRRGLY